MLPSVLLESLDGHHNKSDGSFTFVLDYSTRTLSIIPSKTIWDEPWAWETRRCFREPESETKFCTFGYSYHSDLYTINIDSEIVFS